MHDNRPPPGPQGVIVARLTPSVTAVVPLESVYPPPSPPPSSIPRSTTDSASQSPVPTLPSSPEPGHATIPEAEWQAILAAFYSKPRNSDSPTSDHGPTHSYFNSPPPSPTESEIDWPTRSGDTLLFDDACIDIDSEIVDLADYNFDADRPPLWLPATFNMPKAADVEVTHWYDATASIAADAWAALKAYEAGGRAAEEAAEVASLKAAAKAAAEAAAEALETCLAAKGEDFDSLFHLAEIAALAEDNAAATKAIAQAAEAKLAAHASL